MFFLIFIVPPTPKQETSLIFGKILKDSLLINVSSPRIIFIGGSSASFSLNSQIIKDSLSLNPINTGIAANLGLKYMIDNVSLYLKENDIVVLIPEYAQFYGDYAYGEGGLPHAILGVNHSEIRFLNYKQLKNVIQLIPVFSYAKLSYKEYHDYNHKPDGSYERNSFNCYGDSYRHWSVETGDTISPTSGVFSGGFNYLIIKYMKELQAEIKKKNGKLFVSYPAFQEKSFNNAIEGIKRVESELKNNNFAILGIPERYIMPDSLLFDSNYHLIKKGVDYRTKLLIEDLKKHIQNNERSIN